MPMDLLLTHQERVLYLTLVREYSLWCLDQGYHPLRFPDCQLQAYVDHMVRSGQHFNRVYQFLFAASWFQEVQEYLGDVVEPPFE